MRAWPSLSYKMKMAAPLGTVRPGGSKNQDLQHLPCRPGSRTRRDPATSWNHLLLLAILSSP